MLSEPAFQMDIGVLNTWDGSFEANHIESETTDLCAQLPYCVAQSGLELLPGRPARSWV